MKAIIAMLAALVVLYAITPAHAGITECANLIKSTNADRSNGVIVSVAGVRKGQFAMVMDSGASKSQGAAEKIQDCLAGIGVNQTEFFLVKSKGYFKCGYKPISRVWMCGQPETDPKLTKFFMQVWKDGK